MKYILIQMYIKYMYYFIFICIYIHYTLFKSAMSSCVNCVSSHLCNRQIMQFVWHKDFCSDQLRMSFHIIYNAAFIREYEDSKAVC